MLHRCLSVAVTLLLLSTATAQGQLSVNARTRPQADFSASQTTGVLPLTVSFTDLSVGPVTGWTWDFGDDETILEPVRVQNPTRTYTQPGTYDVSLTVTGPAGSSTKVEVGLITVMAPVPDISVDFPEYVHESEEVNFTVTVTDPNLDRVSVVCTNPPRGLIFEPAVSVETPVTLHGRYIGVPPGGSMRLRFSARNDSFPTEQASAYARTTLISYADTAHFAVGDVTGDGIDDVVARSFKNGTTIHLWHGKSTPAGSEDAILDRGALNLEQGRPIDLIDLTGDGILDVVLQGTLSGQQAYRIFAGGPQLVGTVAPTATCVGQVGVRSLMDVYPLYGDVTGDGIEDIVSAVRDGNGVYVWAGGPTLTGNAMPTAQMPIAAIDGGENLGNLDGQGMYLVDVTGDGTRDVVIGTSDGEFGAGPTNVGALFVLAGGPGVSGTVTPTATLSVPGAVTGDRLGNVPDGQGLYFADPNGDGVTDVLAITTTADVGGVANTGAAYMWSGGGSLIGTVAPTATLTVPGALPTANLGLFSPRAMLFADITGDAVVDVITGTAFAGSDQAGAAYVFAGGAGFTGSLSPTATLSVSVMGDSPRLSHAQFADVVGDATLDVVALAPRYDAGGFDDSGAVFVWPGGATMTGSPTPVATLTAPTADSEFLGTGFDTTPIAGKLLHFQDVNDDGRADVLAATPNATVGGVARAGHIVYWAGGATLSGTPSPTATLSIPSPSTLDALGSTLLQGIYVADVSGDGVPDVVASTPSYDTGVTNHDGGIFVWQGGASLTGTPSPHAVLTFTDDLTVLTRTTIVLVDLNGDGVLDIFTGDVLANVDGNSSVGALYTWLGGSGLTGTPAALRLTSPMRSFDDRLGSVDGFGFLLTERFLDLNGDGIVDALAAAAKGNAGALDSGYMCNWLAPLNASAEGVLLVQDNPGNNEFLGR